MSEENAPNPQPDATAAPAPESVSVGSAGNPEPPKLGDKVDFVARAMAKLAEQNATPSPAPATPEPAPEPEPPAEDAPPPTAAQQAAARIARGEPRPEAPPEPAISDDDPKAMASMAKLVELEQAARAERAKLDEQRRALEQQQQQVAELMRAREIIANGGSRLEALAALGEGWTYEDLTREVLGGKAPAGPASKELEELRAELARVKEELPKEWEQKFEAERKAREEAETQALRQQAASVLKSDAERWGLHYRSTNGEVLPFAQAADILETEIERAHRERAASGQSKLARIYGLSQPPALSAHPETPATTAAGRSPDVPAGQTLTPDLASRAPASPPDDRPMTTSDWVRRATEVAAQEIGTKV